MKYIFTSLLIFAFACGNFESKKENNEKIKITAKKISTSIFVNKVVSITNDKFIENVIDKDFQPQNIDSICRGFDKKIKLVRSDYSDKFDTIINYFRNSDTIVIYATQEKKNILKISLNTDRISVLNNSIKIGLEKTILLNLFPSKKDYDTLKIYDTEKFSFILFSIKKGKIFSIKYQTNYMD